MQCQVVAVGVKIFRVERVYFYVVADALLDFVACQNHRSIRSVGGEEVVAKARCSIQFDDFVNDSS